MTTNSFLRYPATVQIFDLLAPSTKPIRSSNKHITDLQFTFHCSRPRSSSVLAPWPIRKIRKGKTVYFAPAKDHPMEKNNCWPFHLPTADQLTEWILTQKHMIDGISSSQGFISTVEHKTRQVTELFLFYVIARCDGLCANKHQIASLISQHLHLGYQPYMHRPHGKPDQLYLYLENKPYTSYARAVLSTGLTMTLDEIEVVCYPVKDVGIPYDFLIEERKATTIEHLKLKIYGFPLHLWAIRAVERVIRLYRIYFSSYFCPCFGL